MWWLYVYGWSLVAGAVAGGYRGRLGDGLLLAFLFGPLGVIVAATLPLGDSVIEREIRARMSITARVEMERTSRRGAPGEGLSNYGDD